MSLRLQVTTSNLTNRYFPGHTKDPNSANTKKAMKGMILFRGGINTYEALDLSALHLKDYQ